MNRVRKKLDSLLKRVNTLPIDLQLVFYDDLCEAINNRLKVLEQQVSKGVLYEESSNTGFKHK